jgi:hypothetical protein
LHGCHDAGRVRQQHQPPSRFLLACCAGPPQEFNETFYCDQAACYGYQANATIWPLARQACKRAGGDLVRIDSFDKQMALETYFAESKVLNASFYWIGFGRTNYTNPYRWVQGDRVPPLPNRFPYGHWTWFQPVAVNYTNYDCGLAYGQYAYADYTPLGYSTAELQSPANYQTGAEYAQKPYGWTAYLCNAQSYDYICEYPFSAFSCPPPPSPDSPPGAPGQPPEAPTEPDYNNLLSAVTAGAAQAPDAPDAPPPAAPPKAPRKLPPPPLRSPRPPPVKPPARRPSPPRSPPLPPPRPSPPSPAPPRPPPSPLPPTPCERPAVHVGSSAGGPGSSQHARSYLCCP